MLHFGSPPPMSPVEDGRGRQGDESKDEGGEFKRAEVDDDVRNR